MVDDQVDLVRVGDVTGLVGYWKFDDDTFNDTTTNAFFGTPLGDAMIVNSAIPKCSQTIVVAGPGVYANPTVPVGSGFAVTAFTPSVSARCVAAQAPRKTGSWIVQDPSSSAKPDQMATTDDANWGGPPLRHNSRSVVAFVDGHAEPPRASRGIGP